MEQIENILDSIGDEKEKVTQTSLCPIKNNLTTMNVCRDNENKENLTNKLTPALRRHEEYQYLEKIQEILKHGHTRIDRTNVGTKSIFGSQARYSLRNSKIFKMQACKTEIWKKTPNKTNYSNRYSSFIDNEKSVYQRNNRRAAVVY